MVNSYSETRLHQSSVVAQLGQPLHIIADRFGRRLVFESDHISGLGSTNPRNLCILGGWRLRQCRPDVGVRSRGGEVAAERVSVVFCAQRFSDRTLGADSDAVLVFVNLTPGIPGLRIVCAGCNGRP